MARMAAETVVCCGFNATRAARELRPDLKAHRNFAHRLMREPAVLKEISKIMDKPERNPEKFKEMVWGWAEKLDAALKAGVEVDKATMEAGLNGARILAKGYVSEKPNAPLKPFHVDGQEEGIDALTVVKKVM